MSFSRAARSIGASVTLKLNAEAARMRSAGEPVVHLGGGEPKSHAPQAAIEAGKAMLDTGEIRYTPASGTQAMKDAVVAYTEVLHHENRGRGVRMTCVCPPPVATPLLKQAEENVWPKIFDEAPAIEPQAVLDAIETSLEKGSLWVFPGRGTKLAWRMRRWLPGLMWRRVHQIEGR